MLPTIVEDEIDSVPAMLHPRLATIGLHVAQLVHEIVSPLTAILMRLELLGQPRVRHSGEAVHGVIAEIQDDAKRIERLVDRVREFLTDGRRLDESLRLKPADLNAVVKDAVKAVKRWYDGSATFAEDYGDVPPVLLDTEWFCQALVNLLKNACEAVDGAGTISVRTRNGAHWVEVIVEDNGPGIRPEDIDSLFEPFVTTKTGRGLGLGLPLCEAVVTAHGGEIDVDSAPGQGTTFRILLPTASERLL